MSAMIMANCHWCKVKNVKTLLPSVQSFGRHVTKAHKGNDLKVFRCGQDSCFSTYSDLKTLLKHLKQKHSVPDKRDVTPTSSQSTKNENSDHVERMDISIEDGNSGNQSSDADGSGSFVCDSHNKEIDLSLSNFKEMVFTFSESFVSKQYTKPYIPRNYVQTIINDLTGLFSSGPLGILQDHVLKLLNSSSTENETVAEVEQMFECLKKPFNALHTEYRRTKLFMESEKLIPPISYSLGKRLKSSVNSKGESRASYEDVCGQFIPLGQILKAFLEMGDNLSLIENNVKSLENQQNCISNIVQCPLWKSKVAQMNKSSDDLVLPLLVYSDDFEPNDALGPHSEKLGAVYSSIPCLPAPCLSKLENIFLTLLFDASDRKEYGNAKIFKPLIEELTSLEKNGIIVRGKRVFFILALIIGDNLAVHGMLGLVESFSATFYCRFCRIEKSVSRFLTVEDETLSRTKENYESDLAKDNVSLSGVKEECVFNSIPSFHLTTNYSVDSLHDLVEGVCHTAMIFILCHFVRDNVFDIETLNFRMDMFNYGPIDEANKPPLLSGDALKGSKLKMTGREMVCFVYQFGVLVGDLVSADDNYWKLYLYLRNILDIVMCKSVCMDDEASLRTSVKKYLDLLLELDESNYLKPKDHFLLHYPQVLRQIGPLSQIACWRYEGKHRELKGTATSTTSRKNLPLTIAKKQQLAFYHRIKANNPLIPETLFGPGHLFNLEEHDMFPFFKNTLPDPLKANPSSCYVVNWVEHFGSRYSPKLALIVGIEDHAPLFAQIRLIVAFDNSQDEIVFICEKIKNLSFDGHTHGYHVVLTSSWVCVKFSDLIDPFPVFVCDTNGCGQRIILRSRM